MEALVAIIAVLSVFGIPGFLAYRALEMRHQRKMRELERGKGDDPAELEGLREERKLLVGRIENLESIVCSVEFELNEKLNRLSLEMSGPVGLLEAPKASSPTGEDGGDDSDGGDPRADDPSADLADRPGAPAALSKPAPGLTATDYGPEHRAVRARRVADASGELEIGALLNGRYRIDRLLGRGGMGAVYLADDQALGESVALKVVSSRLAIEPDKAIARFRREAQAARRIAHPNVIRIHDLGEAGALLYISMEYFAGRTLSQILETRGRLSAEELRDLVGQICAGLEAAHGAGVVHRDLKPGNVLVGERDAVKLIDFGLATSELMKGLTATGQMLGTPHYMSPEQVRGQPVDVRSDIYSLGALIFHAVTGEPPFDGPSPIAVGFAHLMEPVPDPRDRGVAISDTLAEAVMRALAKDPKDRPASVAELRRALGAGASP